MPSPYRRPPPTDRRTLVSENYNEPADVTYRVYDDDHVIVYGPERREGGVTDRTRWAASLWVGHPLLTRRRARFVRALVADATWPELWRVLAAWEHEVPP